MNQPGLIGQMIGGAVFVDHSRYVVPDGMVILGADEGGVHVNLRPGWLQKLTLANSRTMAFRGSDRDDIWYAAWGEITIARRDRDSDSIFMMNGIGERVRFTGSIPREMGAFTQELLIRGVPVQRVRSTYWDVYRSRRHWRASM
ncbi:MAG TPA: hypothetical protein VGK17_08175 [Propionicimonas sp.]